jgi:hypothetical protein
LRATHRSERFETAKAASGFSSNIRTVTFAAASATPTFALASATSFAADDRLGIVNEEPADATLAGVSETNDADTWNADYGVVYYLKEDPAAGEGQHLQCSARHL